MVHIRPVVLLELFISSLLLYHPDVVWPDRCRFGKLVSDGVSFPVDVMTNEIVKMCDASMNFIQYMSQCECVTGCGFVYPVTNNFGIAEDLQIMTIFSYSKFDEVVCHGEFSKAIGAIPKSHLNMMIMVF